MNNSRKKVYVDHDAKQRLLKILRDIRATFVVLVMLFFSISSVVFALDLGNYIDVSLRVSHRVFLFIMFALFMHAFSSIFWDGNKWIASDYCMSWLAGLAFFAYMLLGFVTFGAYMYETVEFWIDDLFSIRVFPPFVGAVFFISFVYTNIVYNDA